MKLPESISAFMMESIAATGAPPRLSSPFCGSVEIMTEANSSPSLSTNSKSDAENICDSSSLKERV